MPGFLFSPAVPSDELGQWLAAPRKPRVSAHAAVQRNSGTAPVVGSRVETLVF